jgi:hypothetical protein
MATKPTCLVCHKEMEQGFLTDATYGGIALPRWCAGTPESSIWSGEVSRSQFKTGLKVVAFRCPECQALRLYAPSSDAQH